MTIVYTYFCVVCGSSWHSSKSQQSQPVCRHCYNDLMDADEVSLDHRLAQITTQANSKVETARKRVRSLNEKLADVERMQKNPIHKLLSRFQRSDPVFKLRGDISRAENEFEAAEYISHVCEKKLPTNVNAARARYRSKLIALEQRKQAATRLVLEKQNQRASQFQDIINKLKLDRHLLLIRNKDYKRGNALDNFIRSKWDKIIQGFFSDKCFICKANTDITMDHLWIPKNEGGNFVMCVGESCLLMSNILLLCRSCNSAKGELPVERFFSVDQIVELANIQKVISQQMMKDSELRKVAGNWYGRAIHPVDEPLN